LAKHRVRGEREVFELPLTNHAIAAIMREFGEDGDYFDLHAIAPAGKARLVQLKEESGD